MPNGSPGAITRPRINVPSARDRWLEHFPREVAPSTMAATVSRSITGDLRELHKLFLGMVDTWPSLAGAIGKVQTNVINAPWEVRPFAMPGDEPTTMAIDKATLVESAMQSMQSDPLRLEQGLDGTIRDIIWGYYFGHSVSEMYWQAHPERQGLMAPRATRNVDARYYGYLPFGEGDDRLMLNVEGGTAYRNLVDFPPHKFLVAVRHAHPAHPSIAAPLRVLTMYWMSAVMGLKWFLEYVQKYGIPYMYGTVGKGQDAAAVNDLLADLGATGHGTFEEGTEINTLTNAMGTNIPQEVLLDRADRQAEIYILGQTLTTDVGSSGSRALGEVHREVELDKFDAAASFVGEVLTNQYATPIIEVNFGDRTEVPCICAKMERPKDEKGMVDRDKVLFFDMRVPVSKQWFHERHSIPIPQPDEELLDVAKPMAVNPFAGGDGDETDGELEADDLPPSADPDPEPSDDDDPAGASAKHNPGESADDMALRVLEEITGSDPTFLDEFRPLFSALAAKFMADEAEQRDYEETLAKASGVLPTLFELIDPDQLRAAMEGGSSG